MLPTHLTSLAFVKVAAQTGRLAQLLSKLRSGGQEIGHAWQTASPVEKATFGGGVAATGAGAGMVMHDRFRSPASASPKPPLDTNLVNDNITKTTGPSPEGGMFGPLSPTGKLLAALGSTGGAAGLGAGLGALGGLFGNGSVGGGAITGAGTGAGAGLGVLGGGAAADALGVQNPMGRLAMSAGGGLLGGILGHKVTKKVTGQDREKEASVAVSIPHTAKKASVTRVIRLLGRN